MSGPNLSAQETASPQNNFQLVNSAKEYGFNFHNKYLIFEHCEGRLDLQLLLVSKFLGQTKKLLNNVRKLLLRHAGRSLVLIPYTLTSFFT